MKSVTIPPELRIRNTAVIFEITLFQPEGKNCYPFKFSEYIDKIAGSPGLFHQGREMRCPESKFRPLPPSTMKPIFGETSF